MLGKSKEIFEIGGPRILEECFTVSERSRAISETGVTDHSQNDNRILKRDCRDIRFRKSGWSVRLPAKRSEILTINVSKNMMTQQRVAYLV